MDFVDVLLDPAVDGQSLVLEFTGAPGADAEFAVQVWRLMDPGGHAPPRFVAPWATAPQFLVQTNTNGVLSYVVPDVDTSTCNKLGLIITRVDAMERSDPVGDYIITVTNQ
jgi:hypothetical protein